MFRAQHRLPRGLGWTIAGISSLATWVLIGIGVWVLFTGCAVGSVSVHPSDEVEIHCLTIGANSTVAFKAFYFESGPLTTPPQKQISCTGDDVFPSLFSGIGTLIGSAVKALFGWMVP